MDPTGGVRVVTSIGRAFRVDPLEASGLSGYEVGDLVFRVEPGTVPARADGAVGAVEYGYVLSELGGVTTYFNDTGDPVVRTDGFGNRTDWTWQDGHRLVGVVDADGVVTGLDWDTEPGVVLIYPGQNLPTPTMPDLFGGDLGAGLPGGRPVWRVELVGKRVSAVTDSVGGRTVIGYDPAGLVTNVAGPGGGVTRVGWSDRGDGVPRVDRVRTLDRSGVELSVREWDPVGRNISSGWPVLPGGERGVFGSGSDSYRYTTVLSDGHTRVASTYNSQHLLIGRDVEVETGSGGWVVQEHAFTYFGTDGGEVPDPATLPGSWAHPVKTEVTHHDRAGGSRTVVEEYVFDEQGRAIKRTAADGTVTETEYDQAVPDTSPGPGVPADPVDPVELPIGLPLTETVTAPDGLVAQTRYVLNEDRTGVVAAETWTGKTTDADGGGTEELVRTGRSEFELDATGFITTERVYEQGGTGTAQVTTHARTVDLTAGTVTSSETVAVGTEEAVTSTQAGSLLPGWAQMTDPVGNTTTTIADPAGRVVASIDPAGRRNTVSYGTAQEGGRNATTSTGPDGVTVTEVRDVLGRVVQVTDNLAVADPETGAEPVPGHSRVIETRSYPDPGTVEVTDAWGATTTSMQDVFGRPVRTVAPNGLVSVTVNDDVANTVTTALTPTGNLADAELVSTQRMDAAGQVTNTEGVRQDGRPVLPTSSTFDGFGRETSSTDTVTTTSVVRDVHGNPTTTSTTPTPSAADATGAASGAGGTAAPDTSGVAAAGVAPLVAQRRFDGFGTSVEKTLTDGTTSRSGSTRELDGLGRTIQETDQTGRDTTIVYTVDGLVEEVVDGSGQTTTNTYDPTTREPLESTVSSPVGATVTTGYEYDPVTGNLTGVFDPADRAGTELRYRYDGFGNTTRVTYPDGDQIRYQYDEHGRKMSVTDVAGNTTRYEYDPAGLPTTVTQTSEDGAELASVGYRYDRYGRVTKLSRGNGVTTTYEYTAVSEIATETTTRDDGTEVSKREYEYDARGNLTQRVDTTHDPHGSTQAETNTYAYDPYDRLVHSAVRNGSDAAGPVARDTVYELSPAGDVMSETVTTNDDDAGMAPTVVTRTFAHSPLGELVSIATTQDGTTTIQAQTYDVAGNLTLAADGTRYAYDAVNRPVTESTPDGTSITTQYWANGQRATLTQDDATTRFYWDGTILLNDTHTGADGNADTAEPGDGEPIAAATVPGDGIASYLIGSTRHTRTTTDGSDVSTSYYGADRHGNITDLTNGDGQVTTRYGYTDYGTPTQDDPAAVIGDVQQNPFGYAGEYTNPNPTGQPERTTQHLDIRTYHPGSMQFLSEDPADQHNRYAYANLNPIMMIDPTGRTAIPDGLGFGMAVAGLVLSMAGLVATAVFSGGVSLLFLGAATAAVYDTAVATLEVVDAAGVDIMNDTVAAVLGGVALAVGIGGAADGLISLATRKATSATKAATTTSLVAPTFPTSIKQLRQAANAQDAARAAVDPANFDEAATLYSNDPRRLTAWRLTHHKDGTAKTWYHGTSASFVEPILSNGFDPTRAKVQVYGPGTYFTQSLNVADGFARDKYTKIGFVAASPRLQSAYRVDAPGGENWWDAQVRNPFWTKTNSDVPKFSGKLDLRNDYDTTDAHAIVRKYAKELVVHKQTPEGGVLPLDALRSFEY